jgi:YVTN family beta-propeller protein
MFVLAWAVGDVPAATADGAAITAARKENLYVRPSSLTELPSQAGKPDVLADKHYGPSALAVSRDGKLLYVAGADAREVSWVDLPTGRVVRRVAVQGVPTGLALTPDGTRLVVTCAAPRSTVAVLDAASGRPISTIPAGHTAMGPAISPDGRRLYVCNRFNNDVSIIDLPACKEVARVRTSREPVAAAVAPDGKAVLIADHLPNMRTDRRFEGDVMAVVTRIDAVTLATTAIPLPHGSGVVRGICVSPDGRYAFAAHLLSNFESAPIRVNGGWINTNVVSVIDLRQGKVVRTIGMDSLNLGAGNPWDIACTADGKFVCVSLSGTHELCVIETADLLSDPGKLMSPMMGVWPIYGGLGESLWRRTKLPGKGPRALAVAGMKVYAVQYFSDSVAVVDLAAAPDPAVSEIALGPPPKLTRQRWGELLFHDATICYEQWQSCASCHPDGRVDGLNWDLLNDGEGNPKNTKSLFMAHQMPPVMWEGVRETGEQAVRAGIEQILFSRRPEEEAAAIDEYLKSLKPVPSPHLVDGRLSAAAERGRALFDSERLNCSRCHPDPLYTDLKSHNVGSRGTEDRVEVFRTPTLLEVWRTAPYLHDGRYVSVKDVFAHGKHGLPRRNGKQLTEQEIDDLTAFVLSL